MKPGNRHENEMVPSHTKLKLREMRDRFNFLSYPSAHFCAEGFLFLD